MRCSTATIPAVFLVTFALCWGWTKQQYLDEEQNDAEELEEDDENFRKMSSNSYLPSFSQFDMPPLGHSRPFYFNQETAYSQRSSPFENLFDIPHKFSSDFSKDDYLPRQQPQQAQPAQLKKSDNILGSGNFGVIKGGTFYNEEDVHSKYGDYDYYNNGHGRPSYFGNKPANSKPIHTTQQFANFKDFADINSPSVRQYSQYVVVYTNQNGTNATSTDTPTKVKKPKNIIESLAMLDLESTTTTETPPTKKQSKSKRKLAQLPPEKKHKARLLKKEKETREKDLHEPLLALS